MCIQLYNNQAEQRSVQWLLGAVASLCAGLLIITRLGLRKDRPDDTKNNDPTPSTPDLPVVNSCIPDHPTNVQSNQIEPSTPDPPATPRYPNNRTNSSTLDKKARFAILTAFKTTEPARALLSTRPTQPQPTTQPHPASQRPAATHTPRCTTAFH